MFDINLTAQLAGLSKIAFTDSELEKMTADMIDIIELMDKVREFKNNSAVYVQSAEKYAELRRDKAEESFETEKITQNAQIVKSSSFVVPKVV